MTYRSFINCDADSRACTSCEAKGRATSRRCNGLATSQHVVKAGYDTSCKTHSSPIVNSQVHFSLPMNEVCRCKGA